MYSLPTHVQNSHHQDVHNNNNSKRSKISVFQSIVSLCIIFACFGQIHLNKTYLIRKATISLGPEAFEQKYYNLNIRDKFSAEPLSTLDYPVGEGSVIAIFVTPQDTDQVQVALRSLAFLQGDTDLAHLTPVLIFNEGNLSEEAIQAMTVSTNRPIGFPVVDILSESSVFNSTQRDQQDRSVSWDYNFMRFWVSRIWKEPSIQRFDAVMRIDADSCFKEVNDYLPNFKNDFLYYHSPYVGLTQDSNIDGLYDFVRGWRNNNGESAIAKNQLLSDYAESSWERKQSLPAFLTTFELTRLSFMQQEDVVSFNEALTEKDPYPMMQNKWGDAVLRFLIVSKFAPDDRLMTLPVEGYIHKDRIGCKREEVEEALLFHNVVEGIPHQSE